MCYNFTSAFGLELYQKKTPLTESLFDVALKLFKFPRGLCGKFAKAEVVTALVKIIFAIYEDNKTDAMVFATIGISNEVIRDIIKTPVLADVNLHFVTFLLSLGVIIL